MKVLDKGHRYALASFDGGESEVLQFVKRNNPPWKYPGNVDSSTGTQTQEVLRALIERSEYVNSQIYAPETAEVVGLLRQALFLLEHRHARMHSCEGVALFDSPIELAPFCCTCGHITCGCNAATP